MAVAAALAEAGAVQQMIQAKGRFEPQPATAEAYGEHFRKYVSLYDSLVGMFATEPAEEA